MRPDVEALEDQLLREWSLATVEEYGAALRESGNSRGDLIALDFTLERDRSQPVRAALIEEKHAEAPP